MLFLPKVANSPVPPIEILTLPAFLQLVASGEVLEATPSMGPKVIALENRRYLKLLRVKSRFSTWGLLNPAKRFARNAEKLQALGIPTLQVEAIYRVPHLRCWAVRYRGLEGVSIRHLLKNRQLTSAQQEQLVQFILALHDAGVYFRGLHTGNILLTPDGQMGLIDILDCYFRPYLFHFQRQRNFKHLFRYPEVKPLQEAITARYRELRYKK